MIREIWSDRSTFKRLAFHRGLNIVLATRTGTQPTTDDAGRTRNGAGKSSLVDILRFVLGGQVDKESVLSAPSLNADRFFVTFDLLGESVTASRSPADKALVHVDHASPAWPVQPESKKKESDLTFKKDDWTNLLGQTLFGLPSAHKAPRGLTFGSCRQYWLRQQVSGGFLHWSKAHKNHSQREAAIPLSFLLGFDVHVALAFVEIEELMRQAKSLKKAIDDGLISTALGSPAAIRSNLVKAERALERLKRRLNDEEIVEFYSMYESESAELASALEQIADENFADEQLVGDLEAAMSAEVAPALPDIRRLYDEAKVVLPEVVLRRYAEVEEFHSAIVVNRRAHLEGEVAAARRRIDKRARERESKVRRLDQIRALLRSGTSLAEHRKLERELLQLEGERAELQRRLDLASKLELSRADLKVKSAEAERALRNDLAEREETLRLAIGTFQEISANLYSDPATLDIKATSKGLDFQIHKQDLGSTGVHSVQIFTFDLMLASLCAKRGHWPGFLVHDSHIFDGVDGRQIGLALQEGNRRARELDGQYIVTMNSDDLEKAQVESGLKFDEFVVKPTLDDSPSGGLFGFRFEHQRADATADDA